MRVTHEPDISRDAIFFTLGVKPMKPKEAVVAAGELADWLNISLKAIAGHAAAGVVVRVGRGRYKLKESVKKYCEHSRASASGRGSATSSERTRLLKAQADLVETKSKAARGELVEASAVAEEWSGVLRFVRAGMLAVPSRAASRLPHLSAHDISEIDLEVRSVLTEVGGGK
jgi:phage terminase Nu1 subunit (DNA packaging protein)